MYPAKYAQNINDVLYPELWPDLGFCPAVTGPTGTTVYDMCQSGINGSLSSTTYVLDQGLYAYNIGSGGTITMNTASQSFNPFTQDKAMTIACWVKFPGTGSVVRIIAKSNGSSNREFELFYHGSQNAIYLQNYNGSTDNFVKSSTGNQDDNNWHHIVVSLGSVSNYMIIDGIDVTGSSSFSAISLSNTNPIVFGDDSSGSSQYIGYLDDIRIYRRNLTIGESLMLYKLGRGGAYKSNILLASPPVSPPPSYTTTVTFNVNGDTGTWTVPQGVTSLQLAAWGAGGGGASGLGAAGGGGAGGQYETATVSVSGGDVLPYSVGQGGNTGNGPDGSGTGLQRPDTTLLISALGGMSGGYSSTNITQGQGGYQYGASGSNASGTTGGNGGAGGTGAVGGIGGTSGNPGTDGTSPGAGGGGSGYANTTTSAGGGGQLTITYLQPLIASGGVITGGSNVNHLRFSPVVSGGVFTGGSSNVGSRSSRVASGGVVCGGTAPVAIVGPAGYSSVLAESFATATALVYVFGSSSVSADSSSSVQPAFALNSSVSAVSTATVQPAFGGNSSVNAVSSATATAAGGGYSSASAESSASCQPAWAAYSLANSESFATGNSTVVFIGTTDGANVLAESFGTATGVCQKFGLGSSTAVSSGTAQPAYAGTAHATVVSTGTATPEETFDNNHAIAFATSSAIAHGVCIKYSSGSATAVSTATAKPAYAVRSSVNAGGTSTASSRKILIGTSSVNAISSATATGTKWTVDGAMASATAISSATATGVCHKFAKSTVSAGASSTATGHRLVFASGSATVVSTGVIRSVKDITGTGSATAVSFAIAKSVKTIFETGSATAVSSATAKGSIKYFGSSSVSAVSSATANGAKIVFVSGSATAVSTGTATGAFFHTGKASVTAISSATAIGHRLVFGASSVNAISSAIVKGSAIKFGTSSVNAVSSATAISQLRNVGRSSVSAGATSTATGNRLVFGRSSVNANSSATTSGHRLVFGSSSVLAESFAHVIQLIPKYGYSSVLAESFATASPRASSIAGELQPWLEPQLSCSLYPTLPPESIAMPFVVYTRTTSDIEYYLGKCKNNCTTTISFDIYSQTYLEAVTIGDELAAALNGYLGYIGSVYVFDSEISSITDKFDVLNPGQNTEGTIRTIEVEMYHTHDRDVQPFVYTGEMSLFNQIDNVVTAVFGADITTSYPLVKISRSGLDIENQLNRINQFRHDKYHVKVCSKSALQSVSVAETIRKQLGLYTDHAFESYSYDNANNPIYETTLELDCIAQS